MGKKYKSVSDVVKNLSDDRELHRQKWLKKWTVRKVEYRNSNIRG